MDGAVSWAHSLDVHQRMNLLLPMIKHNAQEDVPVQGVTAGYHCKCRHLEFERPGGRSSARTTDLVRRRFWRRQESTPSSLCPQAEGSPASPGAACRVRLPSVYSRSGKLVVVAWAGRAIGLAGRIPEMTTRTCCQCSIFGRPSFRRPFDRGNSAVRGQPCRGDGRAQVLGDLIRPPLLPAVLPSTLDPAFLHVIMSAHDLQCSQTN